MNTYIERIKKIKRDKVRKHKAKKKYDDDKKKYKKLVNENGGISITDEFPQFFDYDQPAGNIDSHYFFQDIHVAQLVSNSGLKKHYDIGSRVDGFISHLLFSDLIDEIIMLDIRPLPVEIPKLSFIQTNATSLDNISDNSIYSISSLHALEHFGLGRYGDPIDPLACFMAMKAIQRVTAIGGKIYISTPVTMRDECHFNAHRIFCPNTIVEQFDKCTIEEITFIQNGKMTIKKGDDAKKMIDNREYKLGVYDCGIFVFRKNS